MKKCSRCKQIKWKIEFGPSKGAKDGFRSECKECHVVEQQKYYQENRDECLEKSWVRALWRKFKLTPEAYYALLEEQGGLCSICSKPPTEKRRLAVDHDRKCCNGENSCGKCVRGLLHQHCNSFVGWYETNKDSLLKYLNWGKTHAFLVRMRDEITLSEKDQDKVAELLRKNEFLKKQREI